MRPMRLTLALILASTAAAHADGHATGLSGSIVAITNTFQGAQTEGAEVDVSAFGLNNNQFATIGDGVEFPDFITLYDVDLTDGTLSFRWGNGEFAQQLSGPTPDGNHDRNYFLFDLPKGMAITAVTYDAAASDMIEGSAEPKAQLLAPNRFVIDFDGGVIRGAGFNPAFTISVGEAG